MSWFFLVSVALAMPLDEAVDAAIARSPTAELATARVQAADAQLALVQARGRPTASASAGLMLQNEVTFDITQALPALPIPDPSAIQPMVVQPGQMVQLGVDLTQPLYVPSLRAGRHSAELGQDAARAAGAEDRRRVEQATVQAWHASARAHAAVVDAERGVEQVLAILEKGQALVRLGALAQDQLLPFETAVASARANLAMAQAGADTADGILQQLTGLAGEAGAATPPTQVPDVDGLLASLERADLDATQARVTAADSVAALYEASRLPTVAATAGATLLEPAPGFGDELSWRVGVVARVPLTQGGAVRAQVDQAQANANQARAGLALQREQAELEVRQAHGALVRAMAALQLQEEVVRLAELSASAADRRMSGGESSLLAVQRAQAERIAAEARLTQARADAALAADLLRLAVR